MTKEDKIIIWNGIKGIFYLGISIFLIYLGISFIISPEGREVIDKFSNTKIIDLTIGNYLLLLILSLGIIKWFYPTKRNNEKKDKES